ncbi:hypothetical protein [Aeromicrobium sp. Root472D3]|uniref:hypothetical protein n=1 Tax=Aeromicrobium sp. Root472D3 TaxID=1736540 RepID=UPI0006F31BC8|nr:hypothetical protein [Aeromicrobium sp. Root472D3]KQX76050.1 hypothetical protein ASD10_13225 [Aeromicrobium sp. Root472D3]
MPPEAPPPEILGLTNDTWDVVGVLATSGALVITAIAAGIAAWQLFISRGTRLDQSRPYVMVTLEPSPTIFNAIEILVRNAGAGPAHDVRISVDPPLARAREVEGHELENSRFFNEATPLMPPKWELRTWFDMMNERQGTDLPKKFTFTVSYSDGHGHKWIEKSVQDLDVFSSLMFSETYNIHHAAKALREISKTLKGSAAMSSGPLHVATEPVEEIRARRRSAQEAHEAMIQKVEEARSKDAAIGEDSD